MSSAGPQLVRETVRPSPLKGRSPLAHLLHALNQPLTGLQCSMELAVAVLRPADHYVRSLRDGLELVSRIRVLVGAIRELADLEEMKTAGTVVLALDERFRDTVRDLEPIAEAKGVRLSFKIDDSLVVRGPQTVLNNTIFRFLESALTLSRENTDFSIVVEELQQHASVTVSWTRGALPESSPFSSPELGLLIAQAGWEEMGGIWTAEQTESCEICTARIALAPASALPPSAHSGDKQ